MLLHFTKMHGLGNDFVVIDLITQRYRLRPKDILLIADRHFGIGCDQVLVVEHPRNPDVDFRYRIYNCDGSEVEQCGNGARCFAKFVLDKKLTGKRKIKVETSSGIIELGVTADKQVRVNMGKPQLKPADIPFQAEATAPSYNLDVDGQSLSLGAVSMGNPHGVLVVNDVATAPVLELGPVLEAHPRFPQKANIGFMQIIDRRNIKLRVFERGVGETLACGTGACAAVVAGQEQGLLDQSVTVTLPGGALLIEWRGQGHPVMMTGPATTVFEGAIQL
ncbi:diaminopimelate epimerase [Dasania sp. GY-MA-18]|uniref:Diaminopimelate epimerase n=1 Tax=Dasania phycosphaerae TaxID=2950436 RepID=A0A9J6RKK7_9GAMM|nr:MULTISPECIES: diaminopimelate epimerase [Dasania]MCR8922512.1 diaminopimelate epimerase [Dasania sp. GY-MA-18]MCZ0864940.1 diaminopimelate epimerase [Dasania phycosphaerae]MCZ0868668.1 diaminopimelate epimerase [Dasania phycosphaerae]